MKLELDITLQNKDWRVHLEDPEDQVYQIIYHVWDNVDLKEFQSDFPIEVSLMLCDDTEIQGLNRDYREQDKPTNVLSFPSLEYVAPLKPESLIGPIHLGDMALALGVLKREASEQEKTMNDHFTHLVIHGFLHLLGFDHESDDQAEEMESLEIRLLEQLGIANPYGNKAS